MSSSSTIDNRRLVQVIIGLFGTLSVYLIYGLIYERLIMSPYQNIVTKQKEFFVSTAGLVLIERGVSWLMTEIACGVFVQKQQKSSIPKINSIICGFLVFLSAIIFTHGVYTTAFRFAFVIKSGIFVGASLLGLLYSRFISPLAQKPRKMDFLLSLLISGGIGFYWAFDPEICFYVPIDPKVIANVLMIISCFGDGILSIFQAKINENHKPHMLTMMRDISRWTAIFSLLLVLVLGELPYILSYCLSHLGFTFEIAMLSILYFIGQLFLYRAITRMKQNFPGFLQSSRKVLNVHMSFIFSVHKYHPYQIIGLVVSWTSILIQAILMTKISKEQQLKNKKIPSYNEMTEISSEDGELDHHH